MTFEELMDEACKSGHLPNTAKKLLPRALSDKTKGKILKLSPEVVGRVLAVAIYKINHGSIESVDRLTNDELENVGGKI